MRSVYVKKTNNHQILLNAIFNEFGEVEFVDSPINADILIGNNRQCSQWNIPFYQNKIIMTYSWISAEKAILTSNF
jgi:hypothetical protein